MTHPICMTGRISQGDESSARYSKKDETLDTDRLNDGLQILDVPFQREVHTVPIR